MTFSLLQEYNTNDEASVKFNKYQIDRISEILGNLGLVTLASLVLPTFTSQAINTIAVVFGGVVTIMCFSTSIALLKGGKK